MSSPSDATPSAGVLASVGGVTAVTAASTLAAWLTGFYALALLVAVLTLGQAVLLRFLWQQRQLQQGSLLPTVAQACAVQQAAPAQLSPAVLRAGQLQPTRPEPATVGLATPAPVRASSPEPTVRAAPAPRGTPTPVRASADAALTDA